MQIAPVQEIKLRGRRDHVLIWNVADVHLGSALCDEERLERVIHAIKADRNSYWIFAGDLCECIGPQDQRRFDPRTLASWLDMSDLRQLTYRQIEEAKKRFAPIADKCLGVGLGNHEESATKYYGIPTGEAFATAMKAPYLDYYGVVPLRVSRKGSGSHLMCRIVVDHGHGASATPGGRANVLQRAIDRHADTDVIFMGHLHHQQIVVSERIGFNRTMTDTKMRRTVGIMSGAFYKGYKKGVPSYSEKKGYAPSVLGPLAAEVSWRSDATNTQDELAIRPVEPRY